MWIFSRSQSALVCSAYQTQRPAPLTGFDYREHGSKECEYVKCQTSGVM